MSLTAIDRKRDGKNISERLREWASGPISQSSDGIDLANLLTRVAVEIERLKNAVDDMGHAIALFERERDEARQTPKGKET